MIDLLFRITCTPGQDRVLICPPTYGMYAVCAVVNDVGVVRVELETQGGKFEARVDEVSLPPPPSRFFRRAGLMREID